MYTIAESQKEKKCLIFDGYRYLLHRVRHSSTY